jgi:hypothetical protein
VADDREKLIQDLIDAFDPAGIYLGTRGTAETFLEKVVDEAGWRLLPPGGETHERWAVIAYRGGGADMITADPFDDTWRADETEEEWARRTAAEYAAQPGVIRTKLQRRDVHFGPWTEVPAQPAEETDGG